MYTYLYNSNEFIFDSDTFLDISKEQEQEYIDELISIKGNITTSMVNDVYISKLKKERDNLIAIINSQDNTTLNNLSNIYMKDYIEYLNKKNATVYNVYEKLRKKYNKL